VNLTVSVLAGFVPLLFTGSQVQACEGDGIDAHDGVLTLLGSLKCETNGQSTGISFLNMALLDFV
jgi:hypothetical protein